MTGLRLIALFLLVCGSTAAWTMGHAPGPTVTSPLLGRQAPDAALPRTDGTSALVVGSAHGQKAVLIFWATWCPHCYEELGDMDRDIASIEKKGIRIILVDIGETQQDVKKYFDRRRLRLVSFLDTDSYLQEAYRLTGVPTLVFIDQKGIVRSVTHEFPSDYQHYFSAS